MCITTAAARLSKTLIYVGEGIRDGKDVHVLAYQNNATNDSPGPNAMVLPFPTADEMDERNVINTKTFKWFLKDIINASKMRTRSLGSDSFSLNATKGISRSAQVFNVGSYTVVLAENVNQIPEALGRVPENRRPTISDYFLYGYGQLYPDQPIAVCCWDGEIEAEPLLWWYTPKNKDHFFIPTMDAHDGKPPRLSEAVRTDHIISVGAVDPDRIGRHYRINYSGALPPSVMTLLPQYTYGTKLGSTYLNGDMFVKTSNLCAGSTNYKDIPKARRGATFDKAEAQSQDFEMYGWG